jgi:hypothetical protein
MKQTISRNYINTDDAGIYIQKDAITPSWMKRGKYQMPYDKYYTNADIAQYCCDSLMRIAAEYSIDTRHYTFVEPSAGNGSFFNLLPVPNRIGMDVSPQSGGIIEQDFFDWQPDLTKKYITIGNPPFGLRGWLALAFINRAAQFSDLVGFILPMYFNSDGKGSAKFRVRGLNLLHCEELPPDIFHNGKPMSINTVWQVWGKVGENKAQKPRCRSIVEIYTVCTNPQRRCGLDKMNLYDLFIQSTFYDKIQIAQRFEDVKYGSGYGLIIHSNKEAIVQCLNATDWHKHSIRATNHCRHIGKSNIINALIEHGL